MKAVRLSGGRFASLCACRRPTSIFAIRFPFVPIIYSCSRALNTSTILAFEAAALPKARLYNWQYRFLNLDHTPCPKPPPPRHLPQTRSKTIRRAACGVTSSVFATIPADTSGLAITSSTSSGNFEDVRRLRVFGPSSFSLVSAGHALSCRSPRPPKTLG